MKKYSKKLNSFYVIPGYTFFYWGFTIPKRENPYFIKYFKLKRGNLNKDIKLIINNKEYSAKIRLANITTKKFPNRKVIQIFYDRERVTLKALRKLFIYSYASTINKTKSDLKELMELVHNGENKFKVKVASKQKTDFDDMFHFLEDKDLFEYWKDSKSEKNKENFFIDFSRKWISVKKLKEYNNRANVIYLLYHSKNKQLYVGKANKLGERVKKGKGRIGLAEDWDRFMFFEIDPKYNAFIEQIEAFVIRTFSSLLENDVGTEPINEKNVKIVNRQLRKK
jgi:hypothetical protein